MTFFKRFLTWLLHYTGRRWFAPLVSLLAGLDLFIVIIPTDALAVSATLGRPKNWLLIALFVGIGSTLGCIALAYFTALYGESFLHFFGIEPGASASWMQAQEWIKRFGVWAIFLFAVGPLPLQPAIVIGALSGMPMHDIAASSLVGRCTKYVFLCWLASHAPSKLEQLWGIQSELKEVNAATERDPKK